MISVRKSLPPVLSVIIILALSIGSLTLHSFKEKPLSLFNYKLRQSEVKKYFSADTLQPALISKIGKIKNLTANIVNDTAPIWSLFPKDSSQTMDTSSQRFLLIGDSMLEGLGLRLNDYCEQNNHSMSQVIWYCSSTLWYGSCDTITAFIKKYKPTYIILAIGSMELFVRNIKTERKPYVLNILRQIAGYRYVWIGPPNWCDDSGINDLLASTVEPGAFYLSKNLQFNRSTDGVHPTRSSASNWMDSVASFMMNKSLYRVKMELPLTKAKSKPTTTILNPNPPSSL